MDDPLETRMVDLLNDRRIAFERPERDTGDPTNLDFYLPELDMYIEVKQFHTDRIARQLAKVPESKTAMVLIGPKAVEDLEALCTLLWR